MNVCEYTGKLAPLGNFELEPPEEGTGRSGGDGGKIESKLSEVNTRAVCTG